MRLAVSLYVIVLLSVSQVGAETVTTTMSWTEGRYRLSNGCEIRPLPNGEYVYTSANGKEEWGTDIAAKTKELAASGVQADLVNVFKQKPESDSLLVDPQSLGYAPGKYSFSDGGHVRILPNGRFIRWNPDAGVTTVGTDLRSAINRWTTVRKVSLSMIAPIGKDTIAAPTPEPKEPEDDEDTDEKPENEIKNDEDGNTSRLEALIATLTNLVEQLAALVSNLTSRREERAPLISQEEMDKLRNEIEEDELAEANGYESEDQLDNTLPANELQTVATTKPSKESEAVPQLGSSITTEETEYTLVSASTFTPIEK